jgi:ELWxxDGT repeat protein
VLVSDVLPGPSSSEPAGLTAFGGRLYFAADDGVHGRELWQSDGTAAGTRLAQDVAPGLPGSSPEQLTVAGDRLYFTADDGLHGRELWALQLASPGCQPSSAHLCLQDGRFRVEADWRDFQGNTGTGTAVALTPDTGYFWFFNPANVEVVAKVLDGRGVNQAFWVFYGALSSVEYTLTVTDTQTGLSRRYENPAGELASVGDTRGFGPLGAFDTERDSERPRAARSPTLVSARTDPRAATGTCTAGPGRLCLSGDRFAVTAHWKDFQGHTGDGTAVPLTGDTGYFWFFSPANVEVVAKVIDGRAVNDKFWLFYGALSSVEYTLTVTDAQTGAVRMYTNASGNLASVADTGAF